MNFSNKLENNNHYAFEQGPIRPPSEAKSLLLRITRNCPWNRCTFCPVYKGSQFSIRPVEHVKKDIDLIYKYINLFKNFFNDSGVITQKNIEHMRSNISPNEAQAFYAAYAWYFYGAMESVFLQDANAFATKPQKLVEILTYLKNRFPDIKRITSYARAASISRIELHELQQVADSGLNRIHIGFESGSDIILKQVKKGTTKEQQIKAGKMVKKSGVELSEYFMPGLGGKTLSKENAIESADALNQINPDFIRIRSLAIPDVIPLFKEYESGDFERCTDIEIIQELLLFLENLEGITSFFASDHILNLFQELQGRLPDDKEKMVNLLKTFINMDRDRQILYQIGRRFMIFSSLSDMNDKSRVEMAEYTCSQLGVTHNNVDQIIEQQIKRFI